MALRTDPQIVDQAQTDFPVVIGCAVGRVWNFAACDDDVAVAVVFDEIFSAPAPILKIEVGARPDRRENSKVVVLLDISGEEKLILLTRHVPSSREGRLHKRLHANIDRMTGIGQKSSLVTDVIRWALRSGSSVV